MTTDPFRVFLDLHLRMPRQGPGTREATARALKAIGKLPDPLQILDMGCGAGAQTLDLLDLTNANIVAVDAIQIALDLLTTRADQRRIAPDRLQLVQGDMSDLDLEGDTFDVIWSEGAIYSIGFANGLKAWRKHLKPNGHIVVSECSWLTDSPGAATQTFWQENYPDMETRSGNVARAEAQGYQCLETFDLSQEDWWESFYTPQRRIIAEMKKEFPASDLAAMQVLSEATKEADLFEAHGDEYTYIFYILRKLD
jgi:serine/threonine-protein kinase HipA